MTCYNHQTDYLYNRVIAFSMGTFIYLEVSILFQLILICVASETDLQYLLTKKKRAV